MRRLLAGGLLAVLLIVPAPAAPDKAKPGPTDDAADIAEKLNERIDLERYDQVSLRTALEVLQEKLGYTILLDFKDVYANRAEGGGTLQALEQEMVSIPAMRKVRLETVLREVLDQIQADYYIESDHIRVTSGSAKAVATGPMRTLPGLRPGDEETYGSFDTHTEIRHSRMVTAAFKEVPLNEALRAVSLRTGRSVAVNPEAGERAKAPVSALLTNAPFETAVSVLAEAAGLRAFRTGNAAVLVTPERAAKIEATAVVGQGGPMCGFAGLGPTADAERTRVLEEKVRALTDELEKLKKK